MESLAQYQLARHAVGSQRTLLARLGEAVACVEGERCRVVRHHGQSEGSGASLHAVLLDGLDQSVTDAPTLFGRKARNAGVELDAVVNQVLDAAPEVAAVQQAATTLSESADVLKSHRADTYGEGWSNFFKAAFLWNEGMDVAEGEELRFRHRVIIHDDLWERDQVAEAWSAWTYEARNAV